MEEYSTLQRSQSPEIESYSTRNEGNRVNTEVLEDESNSRELQQKTHYFLFDELQKMASELPAIYRQRMPYDLLSLLANSLLDGTVIQIATSLKEVQHLEEKNLCSQRSKLHNEYKVQKQELQKRQKEMEQNCLAAPHRLPLIRSQYSRDLLALEQRKTEELKKKDLKIILDLDQKVMEQQVTFEKAGVPGFHVTNNAQEIRLQMYLLEFIIRLGEMQWPT